MYIATMNSFGRDPDCVGVDGIRDCIGFFLAHKKMLYAIHIPPSSNNTITLARNTFSKWIEDERPRVVGSDTRAYGVMNGDGRSDGADIVRALCMDLNIGRATIIRLNKHLGKKPTMHDSAAVLCEFVPGQDSNLCKLKYKRHDDVTWVKGAATVRSGFYLINSHDQILSTDLNGRGWYDVNERNCTITTKDYF